MTTPTHEPDRFDPVISAIETDTTLATPGHPGDAGYPSALSVLAVAPHEGRPSATDQLLALAQGLAAQGHRMRIVTPDDAIAANIEEMHARDISCWLVRHGAERHPAAVALAAYANAVYHALCAEPTHVVHCVSPRATYAVAAATFAFTLRHPCTPEPAVVTSIYDDGANAVPNAVPTYTRARRHLRLFGDGIIVFATSERDALLGGSGERLGERIHVIPPGRASDAAAMAAVYQTAWERRQRINQQALLPLNA